MRRLTIVSLNAWGGQVWAALAEWLRDLQPDVLCLQEVTRALGPGPDWLRYGDAFRSLDQRADLFADVSGCLPRHQARFAAAARGVLQDGAGRDHWSEHGIAQWVAPHLAWAGQWQGFVHGRFRPDGWGAEPVPRTCQISRIATAEGKTIVIGHLHGLRDPAGKMDTPDRVAQWQALAQALAVFRQADEPTVLAGDLNVLPGSQVFAVLGRLGLQDQVTGRGLTDTRTTLYPKPQRHANYLFTSTDLAAARFAAPAAPEVSDHRPLMLEVVL